MIDIVRLLGREGTIALKFGAWDIVSNTMPGHTVINKFGTGQWSVWLCEGFLRIFTLAFPLFLAHAWQSFTLT